MRDHARPRSITRDQMNTIKSARLSESASTNAVEHIRRRSRVRGHCVSTACGDLATVWLLQLV